MKVFITDTTLFRVNEYISRKDKNGERNSRFLKNTKLGYVCMYIFIYTRQACRKVGMQVITDSKNQFTLIYLQISDFIEGKIKPLKKKKRKR